MTENPPPPSGTPEGDGSTTPPPQSPYGSQPSAPPPPPPNPYASQPPPPAEPYAGNPPAEGQTPYGAEAFPVAPGGPAPVAGVQPGDLLPRFLSRLIDGLILFVVNVILIVVLNNAIAGVIGGIIYLGYYAYLESSRGQTFGKQIMKLRVHGSSGGNPTMEEALRRNAWAALGIVSSIPVLGWLFGLAELVAVIAIAVTISQDPLKRGWHDKFGNTTVTKGG
jgi:uncharacterized RDD family membrane protein YckC